MLDEPRKKSKGSYVPKRKSGPTFSKIKPEKAGHPSGAIALRVIHPPLRQRENQLTIFSHNAYSSAKKRNRT